MTGNGTAGSATWTDSGALYDGYAGSGALWISSGAAVSCTGACWAKMAGRARSTLTAPVRTLTSASLDLGSYTPGNNGSGTATVSNGASIMLAGGDCSIGQTAGSTGKLTIDGTGSTVNLSSYASISAGNAGNGTLIISNGGVISGAILHELRV